MSPSNYYTRSRWIVNSAFGFLYYVIVRFHLSILSNNNKNPKFHELLLYILKLAKNKRIQPTDQNSSELLGQKSTPFAYVFNVLFIVKIIARRRYIQFEIELVVDVKFRNRLLITDLLRSTCPCSAISLTGRRSSSNLIRTNSLEIEIISKCKQMPKNPFRGQRMSLIRKKKPCKIWLNHEALPNFCCFHLLSLSLTFTIFFFVFVVFIQIHGIFLC